jgi:hypothetical protein
MRSEPRLAALLSWEPPVNLRAASSLWKSTHMEDQYTIREWCAAAKLSQALYFKRMRQGLGPKTAHVGKRAVIVESPRQYLNRCIESASAPRNAESG